MSYSYFLLSYTVLIEIYPLVPFLLASSPGCPVQYQSVSFSSMEDLGASDIDTHIVYSTDYEDAC